MPCSRNEPLIIASAWASSSGAEGSAALWQLLQRKIEKPFAEHGALVLRAYEAVVEANRRLRESLTAGAARLKVQVFYPPLALCTDNGAMIAFAGALRLQKNPAAARFDYGFNVKPRWPLDQIDD